MKIFIYKLTSPNGKIYIGQTYKRNGEVSMKFVEFEAFGPNGQVAKVLVNPEQVCMIAPIMVPGEIKRADGEPIGKVASALDFGVKAIPVNCTVAEAKIKLEELGSRN